MLKYRDIAPLIFGYPRILRYGMCQSLKQNWIIALSSHTFSNH